MPGPGDALHYGEWWHADLDTVAGCQLRQGAKAQPDRPGHLGTGRLRSVTVQPWRHGGDGGAQFVRVNGSPVGHTWQGR